MTKPLQTSISTVSPDSVIVSGYRVSEMMGERTFGDMVYLLITGELPNHYEGQMIEAMLVACAEHSINAPSVHTARTVASCGVPVQEAIAAGISAVGEYHGGAGESCARILQTAIRENPHTDPQEIAAQLVAETRKAGKRFPGFGHRFHTPVDPRAVKLLDLADKWELSSSHIALARAITEALKKSTGRTLPMNVDGALAAILSDMGVDWRFGKSIFIIARTAGLAAHVYEEATTGKPLGFAGKSPIDYCGPQERSLQEKKL